MRDDVRVSGFLEEVDEGVRVVLDDVHHVGVWLEDPRGDSVRARWYDDLVWSEGLHAAALRRVAVGHVGEGDVPVDPEACLVADVGECRQRDDNGWLGVGGFAEPGLRVFGREEARLLGVLLLACVLVDHVAHLWGEVLEFVEFGHDIERVRRVRFSL